MFEALDRTAVGLFSKASGHRTLAMVSYEIP
jgi:hypothetical protein